MYYYSLFCASVSCTGRTAFLRADRNQLAKLVDPAERNEVRCFGTDKQVDISDVAFVIRL